MNDKPMIFADSPESATLMTLTGWVSRNGQFFGDNEDLARRAGATHRRCEKHGPFPSYAYCQQCSDERQEAAFNAMPEVPWDGESPLFEYNTRTFFFDREALADHVADQERPAEYLADMALVIGIPQYPGEVDPVDLYQDLLPEDIDDVPAGLQDAFDALNAIIRKQPPLSWTEGKQRAVVTLEQLGIAAEQKGETE